jgi:tRNA/tmRNA/rRNA uracil-C5-methylase (TrmA/RlmC/RlmD family)
MPRLLIDICCGSGTIGLIAAHAQREFHQWQQHRARSQSQPEGRSATNADDIRISSVLGLELVESAVADAKENARLNGITNVTFVAGKAEETIHSALREALATADDGSSTHSSMSSSSSPLVVGIVDPPRQGLHFETLKAIRNCARIQRLVYISCNPSSLVADLTRLVQPATKVCMICVGLFTHVSFFLCVCVYISLIHTQSVGLWPRSVQACAGCRR